MLKQTATLKRQLRRNCKKIRLSLPEKKHQKASQAICEHIQRWNHFKEAGTILTYMPMGGEVDLRPLLHAYPNAKRWAIPRIIGKGRMAFHLCDLDNLELHAYGMLEPKPDCCPIPPEEINIALCPGLAFTQEGHRLGYGGGFYDRFLENFLGITAGITYQNLILDSIPCGDHDIPMQFIITENGIHEVA